MGLEFTRMLPMREGEGLPAGLWYLVAANGAVINVAARAVGGECMVAVLAFTARARAREYLAAARRSGLFPPLVRVRRLDEADRGARSHARDVVLEEGDRPSMAEVRIAVDARMTADRR